MDDLLDMLTLEDLSGNNRDLAEAIGLEGFKKLIKTYGGTSHLYVPKADMVALPIRDKLIRREFDGCNTQRLALKWGLSDRYILEIVKEKAKEIRASPMDGQTSFFR